MNTHWTPKGTSYYCFGVNSSRKLFPQPHPMQTWAMYLHGLLLPFSKPAHMVPVQSHPFPAPFYPSGPQTWAWGDAKRKRGENLAILGQRNYWRNWKGGKQGVDLELRGSLLGKVLSDSERQRPGLGTRPNPKSRLQVLVSKLAPEKERDALLL